MNCPECQEDTLTVAYEDCRVELGIESIGPDGSVYTNDLKDIEYGEGPHVSCDNDCNVSLDDLYNQTDSLGQAI